MESVVDVGPNFWKLTIFVSCIKAFFVSAYHSTDFEVHRNWLAITHNLPVQRWYFENTSEWTLDYPPLFAWFEFALSHLARLFDPQMLELANLNHASHGTVLFQRLSVILTDLVYIYAAKQYCDTCITRQGKTNALLGQQRWTLFILLITNCGLFIVDHIHFQYNGFLFGVLLLSIVKISQEKHLQGAFWFAVLLNLKHIYLYMAPAYFIYLLRNHCFTSVNTDGRVKWRSFSIVNFVSLGFVVLGVFAASFGPFIYMGQLSQVVSRLFPFKRGLCHAYWAPNFWALYNVADKFITTVGVRTDHLAASERASMTGGLVQQFEHTVLPSVKPAATLVATVLSIMPCMLSMWRSRSGPREFMRSLTLCAFGAYMFGWHVHEKAVLLLVIPLSLLSVEKKRDAQIFVFLSTVGHFSLFPLLFTQAETPVKVLLLVITTVFAFTNLPKCFSLGGRQRSCSLPLLNPAETLYLLGLVPLQLYSNLLHWVLGLDARLPFLPLLLTSVYCALGMLYAWGRLYLHALTSEVGLRHLKVK